MCSICSMKRESIVEGPSEGFQPRKKDEIKKTAPGQTEGFGKGPAGKRHLQWSSDAHNLQYQLGVKRGADSPSSGEEGTGKKARRKSPGSDDDALMLDSDKMDEMDDISRATDIQLKMQEYQA